MEVSAETLKTLSDWFLLSLSPVAEPRRAAESSLYDAANQPGFALAVLRLVSEPAADEQIRLAAAVHFKNHLRARWPSSSPSPIPDAEKTVIKDRIVALMLSSALRIRNQLSESLSIISSHDFPLSWPSLLPELVSSLRSETDYTKINGLLGAANSIFSKFRHSFDTTALRIDLKYCLDGFAAPLLEIFLKTSQIISGGTASGSLSADALRPLFESQRLCCEIFYSLNSIELPEFFEDHMREWMTEFLNYLTKAYPVAVENDGTVDSLRSAICENLQLYMEKNEEEFKDYLKDFAGAVWNLLLTPASSPSRDQLTITAIRFLTIVSTSIHHSLFGSPETLQRICHSIVFPNIRLRDDDEELFEMNYVEYIRRDIEGSDIDTRRRIACELLKGLAMNYKEQVMAFVSGQIQEMLAMYSANPVENWKEKDAAIYLVISLATKAGGGGLGTQFIDVLSFFTSVVVPEFQGRSGNECPILQASALKFFSVFREQVPKNVATALLPDVISILRANSNVVHSYAANCIEKLLLIRDRTPVIASVSNALTLQPRYGPSDINPHLAPLIRNLFDALGLPDSKENQYIMKCIMRVLSVADTGGDVARHCIGCLVTVLAEVCKNPINPIFNHYLFEAIAALIKRSCEKDPSLITVFETALFPVLESILRNDVTEFWPYAFQIFAQLVEMSRPPLSVNYMELFKVLLLPETWKRSANAPALVRLLQAYLQKVPSKELNSDGRLSQVLGIFNKLVSAPSTEELGFYVLNTVVENLGFDMIGQYIGHIWTALFTRLQSRPTVKFVNSLLVFMSLVLIKHGPVVLVESINAVQGNIFVAILQKFWIPNLKLISGSIEVKLTSVASTRLICESSSLLDISAAEVWGKMLDSTITLLVQPDQPGADIENEILDVPETTGYSASFARLHNAGKNEDDPVKEIRNPKEFLIKSLSRLSAHTPGRYTAIIEKFVDPVNQNALSQLCTSYGCAIV
ncbi:Exportin-2 [Apostasia shenzhenica]|uniref:Exportin-2 n=1 Tax=Apostasia shenzhenica TaxID=1088818 RepID=A0A2H9ZVG2_9ASPA|nr:Exportin-2 [Apostasia shenzhenica]